MSNHRKTCTCRQCTNGDNKLTITNQTAEWNGFHQNHVVRGSRAIGQPDRQCDIDNVITATNKRLLEKGV